MPIHEKLGLAINRVPANLVFPNGEITRAYTWYVFSQYDVWLERIGGQLLYVARDSAGSFVDHHGQGLINPKRLEPGDRAIFHGRLYRQLALGEFIDKQCLVMELFVKTRKKSNKQPRPSLILRNGERVHRMARLEDAKKLSKSLKARVASS